MLTIISCSDKTSYSGKVFNSNEDVLNLNNKKEVINNLGYPSYIDPIEKKYFYYSEKRNTKNFFDNKLVNRKLIVFHFNSNDTVKLIDEYNLDDQNKIILVEDQTSNEIIEQGLLEKIFGGVGASTLPANQ